MKDIKFRAWDSLANKMYNWSELLNQNLKNIFTIPEQCGYSLMQYTGLKAKNGIEIYEGDIVKFRFKEDREEFPDLIGYIEYQSTFAAFRIMSNQGSFKIDITEIKFIEVIGNIYDNKNLLEEGEKK